MGVSRKETSTQRKRRLEKKRTTRKLKLANESEEEKRQRLQKQRDRAHKARLEKLARQDDVPSQVVITGHNPKMFENPTTSTSLSSFPSSCKLHPNRSGFHLPPSLLLPSYPANQENPATLVFQPIVCEAVLSNSELNQILLQPLTFNNKFLSSDEVNEAMQYIKLICCDHHENHQEGGKCPPPDDDNDDVVFVTEYRKDEPKETIEILEDEGENVGSEADDGKVVEERPVKRRRKQKIISCQPRKNPVRKAQESRLPILLAEKLAIPNGVFNARISSKPRAETNSIRGVRQSMRTTGAIHDPPSPLRKQDMRSWPIDGMNERPFYDDKTNTLYKFDFNRSKQFISNSRSETLISRHKESRFEILMHERLHLILDHIHKIGEMNKAARNSGDAGIAEGDREVLHDLLLGACQLYVIASGVSWKALTKYINDYKPRDADEQK